ncbi:zinc-ribbon domain-containing protein [Dysosmobacter sp.]|uniref:OB-fold protein n=1 Tax=Dysosmobacter sp. TaxID=2591382 RepID=UPI002629F12B|nr:zinc-ribbon domain-containing protein [Dysosmobacter sp.]
MKEKLKTCPVCGKEMAAGAKACPSCGAKNKKPIYRRWWFWVLVVLVIAAVGSAMGSEDNGGTDTPQQETTGTPESGAGQAEEPAVTYTAYSVGQLMDDLDSNALKAESTYQDQYVELTGRLNVIDSEGDYISIVPQDDQFAILGVQCYLQTEEQRQQVLEMQIDQVITVRGQITSVGEVMGYLLDVDDFGA